MDLNPLDQTAMNLISPRSIPGLQDAFILVTQLGYAYFWLVALVAWLTLGKKKLVAAVFIVALLFSGIVTDDLKEIFQRARPPGAVAGTAYLTTYSYSFPSEHSVAAFLMATLLAAYLGRRYGLITYPIAGLVGISRIYLEVHYLTDVIAGAVLGIVIGELVIFGLYLYRVWTDRGLFGYLSEIARIRMPAASRSQAFTGILILLLGLCFSDAAQLSGWYFVSLAISLSAYVFVLVQPFMAGDI